MTTISITGIDGLRSALPILLATCYLPRNKKGFSVREFATSAPFPPPLGGNELPRSGGIASMMRLPGPK
jgi:hypothetical protein